MSEGTPALEAFALTQSRRTMDEQIRTWRIPDIVVRQGQFVTVLGEHPSDIKLLLGMLSGLADLTGGVLRIDGEAAEDMDRPQRARLRAHKIGFLFREPKLLPELNVLENVILPHKYIGVSNHEGADRGRSLLDRLGLGHSLSKKPADLSPLEAQFAALARALINQPVIILADEPTAQLSPDEAERFLKLLLEVCQEEQIAVLLGTSEPQFASYGTHSVRLPATTSRPVPLAPKGISAGDLFTDLYETEISPLLRPLGPLLRFVVKPMLYVTAVALVIVFLTFFGLTMAQAGRAGQSVDLGQGISEALNESVGYLGDLLHGNPGAYDSQALFMYWMRSEKSIAGAVSRTLGKSVGLLLLSMALGGLIGVPLGLLGALLRHRKFSLLFVVAAIVGISTPSFFLALLLQILEVTFYRSTGITLLPVGGFGWDEHIVLPALVLAARPIAQVARVSFVALSEVLDADYIRTARAKGLITRHIVSRHALRNAGVPILAATGASLGFSLSSLPIVETIFQWPGMGNLLLGAIRTQQARLAATLALLLGVFFVVIHVGLDFLYHWIDPRLREEQIGLTVKRSWVDVLSSSWSGLREMPDRLESLIPWLRKKEDRLPSLPSINHSGYVSSEEQQRRDAKIKTERRRAWVQSTAGSLPFVLGAIVLVLLLGAVVLGQDLAPYSPYSTYPSLKTDGELTYAPFSPSETFPLGTDQQGRDILSLLLYGARRTLTLAFFAVLARILLGTILGALSGWFSNSLLDRTLMGLTQVIAAFPGLLLAMVLIYAFGIRQGLWVFTLALCLIGWGEAAQFVRGQVMYIREQDYVEGALATGLGDVQLLARHVLPNLVPSLVVLACLEMGGVLMLLAELGFIGVFIGGGTRTVLASDALVTYFDVPEWGVMLSNTWRSFRSQPWMTFYPALAFTIAIVGFNLFGEGLRRLTERLTLSMHRIINRYTIGAALGIGVLFVMAVEGTGAWALFTSVANQFNTERALADISYLASPQLNGRGIDSPELEIAAEYVAGEFAALGLQPAGPQVEGRLSYFVTVPLDYTRLTTMPLFELYDRGGNTLMPLTYRSDYAEVPDAVNRFDDLKAEVVCIGMDMTSEGWPESMDPDIPDLLDKIVLLPSGHMPAAIRFLDFRAVLIVADDADYLTHRELATEASLGGYARSQRTAYLFITPRVADAILRQVGYSLEEVRQRQSRLEEGDGFLLYTGVDAAIQMDVSDTRRTTVRYVQAFIPGRDVGSEFLDVGMDREMVILLANYDGLGRDLDGTLYPGANKNASGVAVLLETARLLKQADYQPYRTIMFVAWAGEELREEPSFWHMLRDRPGFLERYRISAVIELIGVGAGTSETLLLDRSTSGRLTEALQQATRRSNVNTSTLGASIEGLYTDLYPAPDPKIPYISITWDGSYSTAHTSHDTIDNIDPDKLHGAGRVAALAMMYLAHEKEY
jgi:ABC-type dipeptide/oligopeptide/nickel transport system permease subunit/ABC-type lipoprotein export system ATPase subunit